MGHTGRDDVADFLVEMQAAIDELPLDDMTPEDAVYILTALRTVTFKRVTAAGLRSTPRLRLIRCSP